jgi:exoribonuclease R
LKLYAILFFSLILSPVCSLREKQDRFAFSVIWDFDPKTATITNTWFGKSVINSLHEMNYEQAQKILDDDKSDLELFGEQEWNAIKKDLVLMRSIFRKLHVLK